jgi:NAD(P)-dependent dehydrogenase (short-subunit alcohol dehydrogenase family)
MTGHVNRLTGANTEEKSQTLTGKTVLVTGSTRGIGLDIAKGMLARGANVMFHGTPKDDGKPDATFRE